VSRLVSLGYSVKKEDHEFFAGLNGGGIILVKRDIGRWFPAALLRTDCAFRKPAGFPRHGDYGISVLAPKITAEHRLQLAVVPLAPCPFFSVEPIEKDNSYCLVAFGFTELDNRSMPILVEDFPDLGIRIERSEDVSALAGDAFPKICRERFVYQWYRIDAAPNVHFSSKMAAFVYFGLDMVAKSHGRLVVAHLFSSRFIEGLDFPSAAKWTKPPARAKQTADQW
jgi:hypothetical protein